jgi:hypothetical protein
MKLHQARYQAGQGWDSLPAPQDWDSENTLILAFCAPEFMDSPAAIRELRARYPRSVFAGCSTSGEIQGERLSDHSIVLSFVRLEGSRLHSRMVPIEGPEQSFAVGERLAQALLEGTKGGPLRGALIFSDGLQANGSRLSEGFNHGLGDYPKIVIGGGLAGDGSDFRRTFVVYDADVWAKHVLVVGFYGDDLEISAASRGGWDIFGPERIITRSQGNVLYEIDGRPALDLYKEYLGEKAAQLPASGLLFPLQISPDADGGKRLVRTILAVDESTHSLVFAGDVPQGWRGQLMKANFDRLIDGAGRAYAEDCVGRPANDADPELVLAVSCVGRRLVLGPRTPEELEAIRALAQPNDQMIGFYSYGELGPAQKDRPCELHNQSMTLFALRERAHQQARKAG